MLLLLLLLLVGEAGRDGEVCRSRGVIDRLGGTAAMGWRCGVQSSSPGLGSVANGDGMGRAARCCWWMELGGAGLCSVGEFLAWRVAGAGNGRDGNCEPGVDSWQALCGRMLPHCFALDDICSIEM